MPKRCSGFPGSALFTTCAHEPGRAIPIGLSFALLLLVPAAATGCVLGADATRKADSAYAARVDSSLMRLALIDSILTDTAAGTWSVSERTNEIDDTRSVVLSLASDHVLDPRRPRLYIRCRNKATDLFVTTDGPVESVGRNDMVLVRHRFDNQRPMTDMWSQSRLNGAIVAQRPIPLARQISTARRWRVEYHPFGSDPKVASFRIGRLGDVLPRVSTTCHWPTGTSTSHPAPSALR